MKSLFEYIKFLELKKPVRLQYMTKIYTVADAEYQARYNSKGKLREHKIWVYIANNTRDIDTLIAHELIHAWQEENNKKEIHGKHFIKYARKMEKHFNLKEIYIPELDTE